MNLWEKLALAIVTGFVIVVIGSHVAKQNAPKVDPLNPAPPGVKQRLLYLSQASCIPCAKMERTFKNADVKARIERGFVFQKLTGREAEAYKPAGYPCYVILSPDGKEVRRGTGYRSPPEFLAWLDGAGEEQAMLLEFALEAGRRGNSCVFVRGHPFTPAKREDDP